MMNNSKQWRSALKDVLTTGDLIGAQASGGAEFGGGASIELRGYVTRWPMSRPVLWESARKLGFKFMAAEAAWILSGDNRVETIAPYARNIVRFSDDGYRFFGAYGPRVVSQLSYVVDVLKRDPASRQAVMVIWREAPYPTADVPCTLTLQFMIRRNRLHAIASMRSSDLWTGVPYDVFNFSMIAAAVAIELRAGSDGESGLDLGELVLLAGSQHLYVKDRAAAETLLNEPEPEDQAGRLIVGRYATTQQLIDHLWHAANHEGTMLMLDYYD